MKNKKLIMSIGAITGITVITLSIVLPLTLVNKKNEDTYKDEEFMLLEKELNRLTELPEIELPFDTAKDANGVEAALRENSTLDLNEDYTYTIVIDTEIKTFDISVASRNYGPLGPIILDYEFAPNPDIQLVNIEFSRISRISSVILPIGTENTDESLNDAVWNDHILKLDDINFDYDIDFHLTEDTFTIRVSKGDVPPTAPHTISYVISDDPTDPDIQLVENEKLRISAISDITLPIGTVNSPRQVESAIRKNSVLDLKSNFAYTISVDTSSKTFSIVILRGFVAPTQPIIIGYTIAIDPNIQLVADEVNRLDGYADIILPDTTVNTESSVEAAIRQMDDFIIGRDFQYVIIVSTSKKTFNITVYKGMTVADHPVTISYSIQKSALEHDSLLVSQEYIRLNSLTKSIELPQGTNNDELEIQNYILSDPTFAFNEQFDYEINVNILTSRISIVISKGAARSTALIFNYTIAITPVDYVELERQRLDAINSITLPYSTDSLENLIRAHSVLALNNPRFTYTIQISGNAASGGSFTIIVHEDGKPSSAEVSINFTMSANPAIAVVNERIANLNSANAKPIFAHDDTINETTLLAKYTWSSPYSYQITDFNRNTKTFTITVTVNNYSAKTQEFSYIVTTDPQIELDYYVRNQVSVVTIEDKLVSEYLPLITHVHSNPLSFENLKPLTPTAITNLGIDVTFGNANMDIEFFYFLSKSANETKENSAQYILRIVGKHQLPNGSYIYSLRQNYELQSSDVLPLTGDEKAELDLGIMTQWFQNKNLSATIEVLDGKIQESFIVLNQAFATENNLGTLPVATHGSTYEYKFVKGPEQAGTRQTYFLTVKAINGSWTVTSGEIVISSTDVNAGPIDPSMELVSNERERFVAEILDETGTYDEKTLESVPVRGEKNPTKIMSATFTPQNNVVVTYNTESVDANFEFAIIKVTFSLNGFSTSETYKVTFAKSEEIKEIVDEGKLLYRMKTQQLIYDPWKAKLPDKIVAADWAGLKLEDLIGTVDFDPSDPKYTYTIANRKSFNNDDGTIVLTIIVGHTSLSRTYYSQVSIKGLMRTSQNRTNIMYGYINGKLVNGETPTNIQGANTKLPSEYTNADFAIYNEKIRQPMVLDHSVSNLPLTGLTTQWTIVSADDATGKLYMRVVMRHGVDYIENNIIDVVLTGFKRA